MADISKEYRLLLTYQDKGSKQMTASLKEISGQAKKTEEETDKLKKTNKSTEDSFLTFGNAIKAFVALRATQGVIRFLRESSIESANLEHSLNITRLAFENTNRTFNQGSIVKFAKDLQDSTNACASQSIAAISLLSNLTKLNEEGITRTTALAASMGKVFGTDTLPMAQALGYYLETGMTRTLKSYGVKVGEATTETERFNEIMKFEKKYMEEAKGIADDTVGVNQKLANSMSDLKRAIGDDLNPALSQMKLLLIDSVDWFTKLIEASNKYSNQGKQNTLKFYKDIENQIITGKGTVIPPPGWKGGEVSSIYKSLGGFSKGEKLNIIDAWIAGLEKTDTEAERRKQANAAIGYQWINPNKPTKPTGVTGGKPKDMLEWFNEFKKTLPTDDIDELKQSMIDLHREGLSKFGEHIFEAQDALERLIPKEKTLIDINKMLNDQFKQKWEGMTFGGYAGVDEAILKQHQLFTEYFSKNKPKFDEEGLIFPSDYELEKSASEKSGRQQTPYHLPDMGKSKTKTLIDPLTGEIIATAEDTGKKFGLEFWSAFAMTTAQAAKGGSITSSLDALNTALMVANVITPGIGIPISLALNIASMFTGKSNKAPVLTKPVDVRVVNTEELTESILLGISRRYMLYESSGAGRGSFQDSLYRETSNSIRRFG